MKVYSHVIDDTIFTGTLLAGGSSLYYSRKSKCGQSAFVFAGILKVFWDDQS